MSTTPASPFELHRSAAFAVAAMAMLIPANLLPIIDTQLAGEPRTDTIWSGIVELFESGLWPLAVIVFLASLAIPFFKLVGLGVLLAAVRRPVREEARRRLTRLYAVLDVIGRWSMLDVFFVAFLAGIVRFGAPASVAPRAGIAAFGAAVIFTILATRSFDPRLIWRSTTPATPQPA